MKVSPVSFGSTYIVKSKENEFEKLITTYSLKNSRDFDVYRTSDMKHKLSYQVNVVAPDKFDEQIESFLVQNGVVFHKKKDSELLDKDNILKRIIVPNHVYGNSKYLPYLVFVKTDNFDNMFKYSFQSLEDYEQMDI